MSPSTLSIALYNGRLVKKIFKISRLNEFDSLMSQEMWIKSLKNNKPGTRILVTNVSTKEKTNYISYNQGARYLGLNFQVLKNSAITGKLAKGIYKVEMV